jgi:biotin operon repressor
MVLLAPPQLARLSDYARSSRHSPLEQASKALLDAWDARACGDDAIADTLNGHVAALRSALAASASVAAAIDPSRPQKDTKQAQVLAMLRRNEGASGPQIAETMGWASHTVRGFLAGLTKKGIQVNVLERVRQVGLNKQGAKGSYSVYRVAG